MISLDKQKYDTEGYVDLIVPSITFVIRQINGMPKVIYIFMHKIYDEKIPT